VKKLLSIFIAIIAILAFTVPAMAATVDTNVTVGTNSTAPYMILSTMTPDDSVATGVQVDPEFAKPDVNGNFPPTSVANDGWKLVKFYVEIGHINGISNIGNVAIDVNYPASFNDQDAALFAARANTLKFEINAKRDATSSTGWSSTIVYPYPEVYPATSSTGTTTPAVIPAMSVRELIYNTPSGTNYDMVDVNANNTLGDTPDKNWQSFLPYWGTDRINYAPNYDASLAFDKFQLGQALVLEIDGWMWFHQPGVKYSVEAKAWTADGSTSPVLGDGGKFLNYNRVVGLYTDFSTVNYLNVSVGNTSYAEGDRWLSTPNLTTVWNNGNAGAQVLVSSTKMVKDYTGSAADIHSSIYYNSAAKTIATFDAKLYYTNGAGSILQLGDIDYFADATPAVIENNNSAGEIGPIGAVLLQSCRPAKIEFSVHPELNESQEAGNYKGFLTLAVAPYTGTQLPTP
jgi:hypothetical protein